MADKKGAPAVVRNTFRPLFHFYPDDQIEQIVRAADADILADD
jgi:hypothetical protein